MEEIKEADYYSRTDYISASMVITYLKSPSLYRKMYNDKTVVKEETPAMTLGKMIDSILTEPVGEFERRYCKKVLKSEDPVEYERQKNNPSICVVSEGTYNKALNIAAAVARTSAYKWIIEHNAISQVILTGIIDGIKVRGKLDWLVIEDDRIVILDLKSTQSILAIKYFYHASDLRYFLSMAMYKALVEQNYPGKKVVCKHLVVTSDQEAPQVSAFVLNNERIESELETIKNCLHSIVVEKNFEDRDVSWQDEVEIGKFKEGEEKVFELIDL